MSENKLGIQIATQIVVSLVMVVMAITLYDYFVVTPKTKTLRIGQVDISAIVRKKESEFARLVTDKNVTDKQRDEAIAMAQVFSKKMAEALGSLPAECGCVLLPRSAIAGRHADIIDYTPEVMRRVGMTP